MGFWSLHPPLFLAAVDAHTDVEVTFINPSTSEANILRRYVVSSEGEVFFFHRHVPTIFLVWGLRSTGLLAGIIRHICVHSLLSLQRAHTPCRYVSQVASRGQGETDRSS